MLRLSRLTDYGIVLMAHLASSEEEGPHNAREVSEATALPLPVVSKILKTLARGGLLESQRGAKGGYALARSADRITVPEMIGVLEGPIALTDCTLHTNACPQEASCHVREPWQRINAAVSQALENITLAELAAQPAAGTRIPLASLGVDPSSIDATRT